LWGLGVSSLVALIATIILTSFPPSSARADQVADVTISHNCPHPGVATISLSTTTPGATIRFTTSHFGAPPDPTHTSGTVYTHSFTVPYGAGINSVLYIKAFAYEAGYTDSAVSFDECDNTGN
jgi:hypothetical protein